MNWFMRQSREVTLLHEILDRIDLTNRRIRIVMATLDDVLAKVQEQDTQLDGVRELITGLRQQLADLLSGVLTPEQQAKVDAIFAQAEKNSAEIAEAISANTPEAPQA